MSGWLGTSLGYTGGAGVEFPSTTEIQGSIFSSDTSDLNMCFNECDFLSVTCFGWKCSPGEAHLWQVIRSSWWHQGCVQKSHAICFIVRYIYTFCHFILMSMMNFHSMAWVVTEEWFWTLCHIAHVLYISVNIGTTFSFCLPRYILRLQLSPSLFFVKYSYHGYRCCSHLSLQWIAAWWVTKALSLTINLLSPGFALNKCTSSVLTYMHSSNSV